MNFINLYIFMLSYCSRFTSCLANCKFTKYFYDMNNLKILFVDIFIRVLFLYSKLNFFL
uniref:Uncharacterized protein n=1 Tax=Laurencieae sp. TaxID=2007162 RepID=A0A1Z1M264_9FLOR|nr:hypothetical protein [Laurencieae sp.]